MKQSINKVPKKLVTGTIIFVGIVANAADDAGFIVLPPLAALVFIGIGKTFTQSMFVWYAGVAAGFSANIIVSMIDVLLTGFTGPICTNGRSKFVVKSSNEYVFLSCICSSINYTWCDCNWKICSSSFWKIQRLSRGYIQHQKLRHFKLKVLNMHYIHYY